MWTLVLWIY